MTVSSLPTNWLEHALEHRFTEIVPRSFIDHHPGWEHRPYLFGASGRLRGRIRARTFASEGRFVTSIGPLEPVLRFPRRSFSWKTGAKFHEASPPRRSRHPGHMPSGRELQQLFEEVLDELASHLEPLRRALGGESHTLVFPGGGGLMLPTWFRERMHALGVDVVVLDAEGDVPDVLSDLMPTER